MKLGTLLTAALVAPALLVIGGPPAQAVARTYTVTGTTDPSPTPACDGTVCPSLRAAVEAANHDDGSTVQLGAGTFQLSQDELTMTASSLHLLGSGMATTTIEQTGDFRVLFASNQEQSITVDDLTLTGGHAVDADEPIGGAILNLGSMALTHVAVQGNSVIGADASGEAPGDGAPGGTAIGGAIMSFGALTLVSSRVSDNVTQGGAGQAGINGGRGGIATGTIRASGTVTVIDSTFDDNLVLGGLAGKSSTPGGAGGDGGTAFGGALAVTQGTLTMRGSTFSGNHVLGGWLPSGDDTSRHGGDVAGGAVVAQATNISAVNNTFLQNVATAGRGESDGWTRGGQARGGALFAGGSAPVALSANTFADNSAEGSSASSGDNLALEGSGPTTISASIVQSGSSSASGTNCDIAPAVTVESDHNLEDTSPSQCRFQAAHGDLIGQDAQLVYPLGDHGGPTQTMLPSASSPVIGAGGTCIDPTQDPAAPLTVDQRGEARPAGRPCDIGAVQLPIPLNTKPPSISGPIAGGNATCDPGTFLGDGAVTYDYVWTRDGQPVGANQATYPVAIADIGHTLRCTVVAHGAGYDSPPATSAPRTVVPTTPALSSLEQSHSTWRTPSGHSTSVPIGTTFRFTLSEKGTVSITFTRVTYRRLVNGHCVALTSANRSRPMCSAAYARAGTLVRSGRAGRNSLDYRGLLSTGGYLHSGLYVATFTAENTWGRVSQPVKLRFTVAR